MVVRLWSGRAYEHRIFGDKTIPGNVDRGSLFKPSVNKLSMKDCRKIEIRPGLTKTYGNKVVANMSRIVFVSKLEDDLISWAAVTKVPGRIILLMVKEARIGRRLSFSGQE